MRVSVVLTLLLAASSGAQTFSSPFTLGPVLPGTGLAGDSVGTVAAFDGTNYLVAWLDLRRNPQSADIYAARVTASGTVLDPGGIPISTANGNEWNLQLVFDGTNFLLVWNNDRGGPSRLFGAHVTPGGQVLEPDGFPIANSDDSQDDPVLVTNGTDAVVVWSEYLTSGSDMLAVRIGTGGVIGTPTQITSVSGDEWARAIAFNGAEYMVFMGHGPSNGVLDLYGLRLDSALAPIDSAPVLISTSPDSEGELVAASDGTNFFIAWTERQATGDDDVRATVVSAAGVASTPSGMAIATGPSHQHNLAITWNGTEYALAFADSDLNIIAGERITSAGAVLDPAGVELVSGYNSDPALDCTSPGQCALFFMQGFEGVREPLFQRFSPTFQPIDAAPITAFQSPSAQRSPRGASDGSGALIAWEEDRGLGDGFDVFARRFAVDGGAPAAILPVGTGVGDQDDPAVDFAFGQYLLVYLDDDTGGYGSHVFFRRVSADGAFLDSAPTLISDRSGIQSHPRIAHDSTNWMVTWAAYDNATGHDIYAARVSSAGMVLDPNGFLVTGTDDGEYSPSIAFNGTEYAIGWERYSAGTSSDVLAARVTVDGTVLDQNPTIAIDNGPSYQNEVEVASDGKSFLFAYRSWEIWPGDIYVRRMRSDGTLADAQRIEVVAGNRGEGNPTLVHDGRTYWLGWEDFRDAGSIDLYGTTITSSGTVTTPQGGLWVGESAEQTDPMLGVVGRGNLFLLYTQPDDDAGVGRAQGEYLSDLAPLGGLCLTAAECKSGFCVDGVCCDTACGGGDAGDCLACSEATGAPVDGTCVAAGKGTVCRAWSARCDLAEVCDGVSTSCPADEWVPDGGVCLLPDGGYEERVPYRVGFACSASGTSPLTLAALFALFVLRRASIFRGVHRRARK